MDKLAKIQLAENLSFFCFFLLSSVFDYLFSSGGGVGGGGRGVMTGLISQASGRKPRDQ